MITKFKIYEQQNWWDFEEEKKEKEPLKFEQLRIGEKLVCIKDCINGNYEGNIFVNDHPTFEIKKGEVVTLRGGGTVKGGSLIYFKDTPNGVGAYQIENFDKISNIEAPSFFESKLQEGVKDKFFNFLNKMAAPAVIVYTKDQYDTLMEYLDNNGYKWNSKSKPTEKNHFLFDNGLNNPLLIYINGKSIEFINFKAYLRNTDNGIRKILTVDEFIDSGKYDSKENKKKRKENIEKYVDELDWDN